MTTVGWENKRSRWLCDALYWPARGSIIVMVERGAIEHQLRSGTKFRAKEPAKGYQSESVSCGHCACANMPGPGWRRMEDRKPHALRTFSMGVAPLTGITSSTETSVSLSNTLRLDCALHGRLTHC